MTLEPHPMAIIGGTLIDGTGRPPVRDSVVVLDGDFIAAVGKNGEIELPKGANVIDASGRTVLPGLIDAHMHFMGLGIKMIRAVDLSDTKSIAEALECVEGKISEHGKGKWILGNGWDDSKWDDRRFITKFDVDTVSGDNPVILSRVCGHMTTLNSKALEVAGITKDTQDPPGGQVDKTPEGEPTGVLRDAGHLAYPFVPPVSEEMAIEGLRRACDRALELGCTGVHEAGLDGFGMRVYQKALKRGVLKLRAYLMWRQANAESMDALGLQTGFGDERIRIGSAKMMIDGSMGAHTAALFEPYDDESETKGLLMMDEDELRERIKAVHAQGSQVAVHAIGDYAIEVVINAIEEAMKASPRKDHRHRIEHCELLTSTQIERIRQLGIVPSMQPNFVGEWSGPDGLYQTRIGERRLRQNNPYRFLLDEGVRVAFGSDGMPFSPLYGIWSAVNHPVRQSRISLEEAVKGFTLDAAHSSFEEDIKGSVEPGKLADITILEKNLTEIPPDEIKDVKVHVTIVGGKTLYQNS
ncbi:MAG: amidohydrolase [Candidatus Bathyarchaeota archaeon]|nr:MAG: amidohydrolase [Candidatus Bathyarchaeota archaeon]